MLARSCGFSRGGVEVQEREDPLNRHSAFISLQALTRQVEGHQKVLVTTLDVLLPVDLEEFRPTEENRACPASFAQAQNEVPAEPIAVNQSINTVNADVGPGASGKGTAMNKSRL